ncbi:MAG: hypothetical protein LBG05_04890 [Treponema sp.]|jgi:hypothetical protein|nr:hypothetical protein [Treponema sp.]
MKVTRNRSAELTYHGVICHQARDLFSAGSAAKNSVSKNSLKKRMRWRVIGHSKSLFLNCDGNESEGGQKGDGRPKARDLFLRMGVNPCGGAIATYAKNRYT